jgi:hypothetical protein
VHCMRVESPRPCKGGGYFHGMGDRDGGGVPRANLPPVANTAKADHRQMARIDHDCRRAVDPAKLRELAAHLGLSTHSLKAIGVGYFEQWRCWTFPMRDAQRRICGLRTRHADGAKRCITGSVTGCFIPPWRGVGPVFLVEGPTDMAALCDCKVDGIGRPSAMGGREIIVELVRGRDVLVVADRDAPRQTPDGRIWYPGRDGALALLGDLRQAGINARVTYPGGGHKDVRAWRRAGASTRDLIGLWRKAGLHLEQEKKTDRRRATYGDAAGGDGSHSPAQGANGHGGGEGSHR